MERGVMRSLFYDMATAARYGSKPTPHHGSASIVMAPGEGPDCPWMR